MKMMKMMQSMKKEQRWEHSWKDQNRRVVDASRIACPVGGRRDDVLCRREETRSPEEGEGRAAGCCGDRETLGASGGSSGCRGPRGAWEAIHPEGPSAAGRVREKGGREEGRLCARDTRGRTRPCPGNGRTSEGRERGEGSRGRTVSRNRPDSLGVRRGLHEDGGPGCLHVGEDALLPVHA